MPPEPIDLPRDIGRLQGRIDGLEKQVAENRLATAEQFGRLEKRMDKLEGAIGGVHDKLDDMARTDAERTGMVRGGWWIITALASVAASIGAALSWVFTHLEN